ncbi:hypothetical protein [Dinoroseobacter sp. S76]|uniref:hypothetical protein n=1 Tax=Dinoroseobacter sp. S76 TaxID=3415124 RepID=UPI003C7C572E
MAMCALASPGSAAVIAYDAQGAYLAVTKDAYLGGKFGFPVAARAPAPVPVTAPLPAAPAVPAIDPVVIAILAGILLAVLVLDGGDDDSSSVADTIMPAPEPPATEPPTFPPFDDLPEPPRQSEPPTPQVPSVPLPPALLLLLSAIGGLAWSKRRTA